MSPYPQVFNKKENTNSRFDYVLIIFNIKDGKQAKSAGSTQKRLEEFRNYEKGIKNQVANAKKEEEPFITNRHPKVYSNLKDFYLELRCKI